LQHNSSVAFKFEYNTTPLLDGVPRVQCALVIYYSTGGLQKIAKYINTCCSLGEKIQKSFKWCADSCFWPAVNFVEIRLFGTKLTHGIVLYWKK
jgi:hypothetical protein